MLSSWQRRAAAVAALAVPALVVAGCTSTTPGTAGSPGTSTSAATGGSATGSAKPTSSKSARPRSIDIKNVDPCQILTLQQRQQLGLDRPPTPDVDNKAFVGAKMCVIRDSVHNTDIALTAVTTFGIDTFTDGSRPQVQSEPTQVAGFPALVLRLPDVEYCSVVVDVADGQFLLTTFADDGATRTLSAEQLCQSAQRAAEPAMASLKGGG